MKIWVYADCHFGTEETLRELELQPDFGKCDAFMKILAEEKPDVVVSLGDFSEIMWDTPSALRSAHGKQMAGLRGVTNKFLQGNHDPVGNGILELEGMQFLHGHQWERASDGYVERLHKKAASQEKFTVIAHTHQPELGPNFMNVGSLTLTGTFGEIDGINKRIRRI